jgi:predicted Fe-Mo cluster-binding NifX family protein
MDKRSRTTKSPFGAALAAVVAFSGGLGLTLLPACSAPQEPGQVARSADDEAPDTRDPAGVSPSEILKQYKLHAPPPLTAAAHVAAFLDWAGASHVDEADDVRKAIAGAAQNKGVLSALIAEVERAQTTDHPRALLALGLLGETRSAAAQDYFTELVHRALPDKGTVIDGEIIEQTLAAQLQGKAVDGLAFINSDSSNKVVTEVIGRHGSKIVRAEAINAYLWNHGDTDDARKSLAQVVRKDDAVLLDRVRRVAGETADTFDRKLEQFLAKHPELVAADPEEAKEPVRPDAPGSTDEPPEF